MRVKNPALIIVAIIVMVSLLGIYTATENLNSNEVIVSISTALIVSCIFYVGTTYIPDRQRKRIISRSLQEQYQRFKKSCIDLFLIASNSQEYEFRENLLDHREFRRYFSGRINPTQERWDLVSTSIDDGDYIFTELKSELEYLMHELNHARASVIIYDDEVEDFIIRMNQIIYTMKSAKPRTDDYKYFCRTLWSIFTRWDMIVGQKEEDYIEIMINKIKNA